MDVGVDEAGQAAQTALRCWPSVRRDGRGVQRGDAAVPPCRRPRCQPWGVSQSASNLSLTPHFGDEVVVVAAAGGVRQLDGLASRVVAHAGDEEHRRAHRHFQQSGQLGVGIEGADVLQRTGAAGREVAVEPRPRRPRARAAPIRGSTLTSKAITTWSARRRRLQTAARPARRLFSSSAICSSHGAANANRAPASGASWARKLRWCSSSEKLDGRDGGCSRRRRDVVARAALAVDELLDEAVNRLARGDARG